MANVEVSYEGSVIKSLSASGTLTLATEGKYCDDDIDIVYTAPAGASLQNKTVPAYTPTESQITDTVQADVGYDGLSQAGITINAIPSSYVGSGITRRDSTDLSASGNTVTVPSGYYENNASKSVASGSATTPATTITANPTISVSSGGLITASVSGSQSVTPTVSAGYVSSGSAGTVSVSGSATSQLTTQGAQTITPTGSAQTIASGQYLTGAQTVEGVVCTNLTAANIVSGVTVKIGTSTDDDSVASVTGTASGGDDSLAKTLLSRPAQDTHLVLPSGLTNIADYACYYWSTNLKSITFSNDIVSIGKYAFAEDLVAEITALPASLESVDNYGFKDCYEMTLSSMPSGLKTIGEYAFNNCYNLEITSLPSTVTKIGSYAFSACNKIPSIYCDGAITTLGTNAFTGSSFKPNPILAEARFPNLTGIAVQPAFGNTTLANACKELALVDLGYANSIAANAFYYCRKLSTLILRKTSGVCTISNTNAFTSTPVRGYNSQTATVYVPSDLISSYQAASNWSTYYSNGTVTFSAIEGSQYEIS